VFSTPAEQDSDIESERAALQTQIVWFNKEDSNWGT
jgi:hypothetical protein